MDAFDALLPIHNALVHLPIGIALVLPLLAGVLALSAWRGGASRGGFVALVLVQAVVVGGAYLALRSGEIAEDAAEERGVSEDLIHEHEERAEIFIWIAGGSLVVGLAALAGMTTRARGGLVLLAFLSTLPVAGAAAWTGLAGGDIAHPQDASTATSAAEHDHASGVGDVVRENRTRDAAEHEHAAPAAASQAAPVDVLPLLPARFQAAVKAEMAGLQALVPEASAALAIGDWAALESAADRIAGSYLLAQLSPEEHDALHAALPHAFIERDQAFHSDAQALADAARRRDADQASAWMAELVASCAPCHAQHAPTRFPGLAGPR